MEKMISVRFVFEIIDKLFKTDIQKKNPEQEMGRLKHEINRVINKTIE